MTLRGPVEWARMARFGQTVQRAGLLAVPSALPGFGTDPWRGISTTTLLMRLTFAGLATSERWWLATRKGRA